MSSGSAPPARVLHVLPYDDYAGAELLVASYIERLDRGLIDVELATLAPPGPIAERLQATGIMTHSLGARGRAAAIAGLARIVRRGYDIVNAHGFKATMIARVLVRTLAPGTAFICSVHGLHVTEVEEPDTPKGRFALWLERLAAPLVDVYEVNTRGGIEFLTAAGLDRRRMRHIPNAIDVAHWPVRREPTGVGGPRIVACVARFVARKRHVDLVRALARLRAENFPVDGVFVGFGPTLEPTRALVRTLGLDGYVEFRGRAAPDEVRSILAEADVFCLPTLWEGTVISVMEAMATGLPIVATDVNGVNEVVEDGVTGLLVPPYRHDKLADALRTLVSDRKLAREMGAAGRRRVEEHFQLDRIARDKEDLYTSVARARRSHAGSPARRRRGPIALPSDAPAGHDDVRHEGSRSR